MRRSLLALLFVLVLFAPSAMAADAPIRVLLLTGGHAFDEPQFFGMFDAMENIAVTRATVPEAIPMLEPGLADKYDCIVTYDMCRDALTDERKEAFVALLNKGIGYVSLHHNIGAHRDWDEYARIIGGKYIFADGEYFGREYKTTPWKHGQDLSVHVVDGDHPITKDVKDFTIHDESYGRYYVAPDVHLLLTTDHPENNKEIAWTLTYGRSPVYYLQLGHDAKSYANPAYPKLVLQGIEWAAAERTKLAKKEN